MDSESTEEFDTTQTIDAICNVFQKNGYETVRLGSDIGMIEKIKNEKVDLSLTNQLQKDIRLGRRGNILTIEISSDLSTKKARGNELHFKKDIFSLSDSETALIASEVDRLISKMLE